MVVLAKPDPSDMVQAIEKAISILPNIDPEEMHNRVSVLFKLWWSITIRIVIKCAWFFFSFFFFYLSLSR